jgi:NAD-dependent DNA ligase
MRNYSSTGMLITICWLGSCKGKFLMLFINSNWLKDIKGFGNATIEELYTSGFIASLADIYRLQQRNEARADEDKLVSI